MKPKRKPIPKKVRESVYALCDGHCAYCGCEITPKEMQVDHYLSFEFGFAIAQGQGEIDSADNYLPACRSCNNYKAGMHIEQFRRMVGRWCDILKRDNVTYKNAVRFGQVIENPHEQEFYFEKAGIHIPAMDWDKSFRDQMHKAYFMEGRT